MLGDIKILIDLIEKIWKRQEKNKQKLLEESVEPIFSAFKTVHDGYLNSFDNYLNQIKASEPLDLLPIIHEIEQDKLFSQDSLIRLSAYVKQFQEQDSLSEFISLIEQYLQSPVILLNETLFPWSNVRRSSLIKILYGIDQLTLEMIVASGLLDEVKNQSTAFDQKRIEANSQLLSSLEYTLKNYNLENSLIENSGDGTIVDSQISLNNNKKYLAIKCIYFIIQDTQERYSTIYEQYLQLKYIK